jgi:hypothetical protein
VQQLGSKSLQIKSLHPALEVQPGPLWTMPQLPVAAISSIAAQCRGAGCGACFLEIRFNIITCNHDDVWGQFIFFLFSTGLAPDASMIFLQQHVPVLVTLGGGRGGGRNARNVATQSKKK